MIPNVRNKYLYRKHYQERRHIGAELLPNVVKTLCGKQLDNHYNKEEAEDMSGICSSCYNSWNSLTSFREHRPGHGVTLPKNRQWTKLVEVVEG